MASPVRLCKNQNKNFISNLYTSYKIKHQSGCNSCLVSMNFQQGISREQISMFCVETLISADNPVRVIDLFVDQLDLNKLGFSKTICKQEVARLIIQKTFSSCITMVTLIVSAHRVSWKRSVSAMLKCGG